MNNKSSPLKNEPWNSSEEFTSETARCGLIAKKMGVAPMWTKDGRRIMATCLMVSDNHVIKYHSPEEYAKICRPVTREKFAGMGCIVVGSESTDPRVFTSEYNGLFAESGVMPKKKLTRFFITHNARIEPGTPLLASHFRPGMHVDIYGKSRWLDWVSLRRRFQLKLGRETHGATKNHNRIGSIGRGRKHAGPLKGKKMPGTKGNERVIMAGLKVLRVNTKYNLIYIQSRGVPGEMGNYINVMDSRIYPKKPTVESSPPFPTVSLEEHSKLPEDMYDSTLHRPSDPSIIFEITEEEKKAAAAAAKRLQFGSKLGKTAQKIR